MEANKYQDAMTKGERLALEDLHDKILIMVDDLVEEYVNTDTLCAPPGEDWFPVQTRLTGEFYICSESYDRLPGESWIQLCISAHCIGKNPHGIDDYLGLDVWLRYDPKDGRLTNHRNTDSMSI